ncbi:MAG TPA: lipocalin-like domain-containing protein [Hyphomicrobiaceae bacterium]|nr:lipocalin-like domain-containing protein [Hyphomicrobiaceae bacterium]
MSLTSLVGTWALVRGTCTAADGTPRPAPYGPMGMGRVSFSADGRMVAVVCDCRPELPAGTEREYNSYCGTYTFDGQRLVTKVFAFSDANRLSADQIRDIRVEGRFIVMRPPPRKVPGGPDEQRELWWEKIADV